MSIQIYHNLIIDSRGVLREQTEIDTARSITHTARMRNEHIYTDTTIQFVSRLSPEQRHDFAREKFRQWLAWYLSPGYDLPADSEQMHHDVEQIYLSTYMQEWWWHEWRLYDMQMADWLMDGYSKSLEALGGRHPASIARMMAAHKAAEAYFLAHDQKFNPETKQFSDIEKSYSVAIAKAY